MKQRININCVITCILLIIQTNVVDLFGQNTESDANTKLDSIKTIVIEVDSSVFNLVNNWEEDVWIFSPSDKNLKTLDGLQATEIACWGIEHFNRMKDLFNALHIENAGVSLVGDGAYNDSEEKPLIYITWKKYADSLKGAVRVKFILKKT